VTRPPELDPLFDPVRIGPLTTRNRFYQVPHCNGMGRAFPSAMAAMRGVKAEGGWAVVCTEQCDIHHSSNHQRELRLWDEQDLPQLARAAEQIHAGGALAGVELVHNGSRVANLESRTIPIAPSATPTKGIHPVTARAMDKRDIAALRRWHRTAALNARRAGFDIVYVYAGHDIALPVHFLSRQHNQRTDEYGGTLANRTRLLRELLEDTHEAVGDTCAVALRFGVDRLPGARDETSRAEAREVVHLLADLPDLWDVNLADWNDDGASARFRDEGHQESAVSFVRSVTTRPVVGVGRFTSPDTMAAMIRRGVLDLIGAARPSIADPFLPRKIEQGRLSDIRECIGCNVCVAYDKAGVPMRCTQNPTMGEEWRRGWHPERIPAAATNDTVLVIGAGPAGLEAARALGQRGHQVLLAESERELGGRAVRESRLPGLATWRRVSDWRTEQLRRMANVTILPGCTISAEDALEAEVSVIAVATGATWRRDGTGRRHSHPLTGLTHLPVFTPDDVMAGRLPSGRVVVYDDDHYYMGGLMAEVLTAAGCTLTYVTPESLVSSWTQYTTEQPAIQRRLLERCAAVHVSTDLAGLDADGVELRCTYTGRTWPVPADAAVLVTAMEPRDELHRDLQASSSTLRAAGVERIVALGDCRGPGTIAAAVHSGHLFARTLGDDLTDATPYRRENVAEAGPTSAPVAAEVIGAAGRRPLPLVAARTAEGDQ
jgi:dimethylamine/trimethylamine dehydrogenase